MTMSQSGDRVCPECGQDGNGPFCHHWDAGIERKVPTRPFCPACHDDDSIWRVAEALFDEEYDGSMEWSRALRKHEFYYERAKRILAIAAEPPSRGRSDG